MTILTTCSRCVLDTTVSNIKFDENGICNYCKIHDDLESYFPLGSTGTSKLDSIVNKIKFNGKNLDYDCVIGVSGGTDSTYVLHLAKKMGLRPLAVHFDNGWNTDESVTNIKNITTLLGVDLYTYVVDWEEFKSLQIAFLKASTPCIEAPSDVAIHGTLLRVAKKFGIKYILGGQSFRTEGTVPRVWSYLDGTYVKAINSKFGTTKLKSYPNVSLWGVFYYTFIKRIKQVPILNYISYSKIEAKKELATVYNWKDYGGHHYENIYSKFAFGWYLPKKFNIDKRKVSLSGPLRSGQITRQQALQELTILPDIKMELVEYVYKKLGLSKQEFDHYLSIIPRTYQDYPNSEKVLKKFSWLVKLATHWGLLTPVIYQKYFKN